MLETEIEELYKTTLDKMISSPEPSSFMQAYMVISVCDKILAMKGLKAVTSVTIEIDTTQVKKT